MKKRNYVYLQLILAAVLIGLGVLIELRGTHKVDGVSHLLFVVPGTIILLGLFIDFIQLRKIWMYFTVYACLYLVFEIVVVVGFKVPVTALVVGLIIGSMILSAGITTIFHVIYDNLKHPDRLIQL